MGTWSSGPWAPLPAARPCEQVLGSWGCLVDLLAQVEGVEVGSRSTQRERSPSDSTGPSSWPILPL